MTPNPLPGRRFLETPSSLVRFGFARGDITPPVGIYHRMWGAAFHDRAEGVHRPLSATVLIFQDPGESSNADARQVLVALDHCLLGKTEMDELLAAMEQRTGVARESLLVVFSHTHAAGLMSLDRAEMPGGDQIAPYLRHVSQTVADLVMSARQSMTSAVITYGEGRCDLAAHRDFWDDVTRQWVCGFNPDGPADDTVMVARVTGEDGRMLASIVNYACHPTTLAWQNRLISPDYPGAMRECVEEATGVPCVFIQGASGELGPREGYVGDTDVADRNGRQLAYAALAALTSLPPAFTRFVYSGPVVSGATLGAWQHVLADDLQRTRWRRWRASREPLPIRYRPGLPQLSEVEAAREKWLAEEQSAISDGNDARRRDCRAMVERQTRMLARLRSLPPGDRFPYELKVWNMGDAIWVAAQGEPYSLLQTALRTKFPGTPIVVCSIANGWGPSYIPPAEIYDRGLYQESIALLAPGSLEQIIAEATCRVQTLLATDPASSGQPASDR